MITSQDEEYVFTKAYIPEHIVGLMAIISKGEPFLIEDHLIFAKDNWLIFVGYPLNGIFSQQRCEKVLKRVLERFRPDILCLIGPEIPASLLSSCQERETDQYYRLDVDKVNVKTSLQRAVRQAGAGERDGVRGDSVDYNEI
jgi:hypothetical protein